MADEREEAMLELMNECQRILMRCQNQLSEIWAEWTRLHVPTIDRSGPAPKGTPRRKVVRRG